MGATMLDLTAVPITPPDDIIWPIEAWNRDDMSASVAADVEMLAKRVQPDAQAILVWIWSERDGPMHCWKHDRLADAIVNCYSLTVTHRASIGIMVTDDQCRDLLSFREAQRWREDPEGRDAYPAHSSIFLCCD